MTSATLTTLLSPDDVVLRLEEAQCASPHTAARSLRAIAPVVSRAHPKVTEAALTILEIHPHETIPYIPDLISDSPEDTTSVLQAFSNLLQTDRSLLVPIIATLPDLRLTAAHALHARATLSFALSVVDEMDLPAVVRALLRSASSPASAEWTARAVRTGLSRPALQSSMTPLLSHVLNDVLQSSSHIARALRAHAGSPFLWPDLLIWVLSFSPRLSSPFPEREARASVITALDSGLLVHPSRLRAHVALATPALAEIPHAVHRFAISVVEACPTRLADVAGCVHLMRALVLTCPAIIEPLAQDLASSAQFVSHVILRALLASGIRLPYARGTLSECVTLACEIDKDSDARPTSSVWNHLFVKIRKGLLFGLEGQRTAAIQLAADVVRHASKTAVREVLSILHDCVAQSLADDTAVDMLTITQEAVMRGAVDRAFVSTVFDTRVAPHCPSKFYDEELDSDGRAIGIMDAMSIKIDAGMIWNQPPAAAATVASAAALCLGYRRCNGATDKLSFNILNVMVLVPVVCVSLYEAVDHINRDADIGYWESSRGSSMHMIKDDELPEEVKEMTTQDLAKAVSAFGVGIAAIVGVLNTACKSFERCKRIVERRANGFNDDHETADHRVTWALLERLTELHRMVSALTLGYEMLSRARGDGKASKSKVRPRSGRKKKMQTGQTGKIFTSDEALFRADAVVANVTAALFGTTRNPPNPDRQSEFFRYRFPSLRLETIIAILAAIPDESEMQAEGTSSITERDVELMQMDKFLLRLLLRSMCETKVSPAKQLSKDLEENDLLEEPPNHSVVAHVNHVFQRVLEKSHDSTNTSKVPKTLEAVFEELGNLMDKNVDIIFVDEEVDFAEAENIEKTDACEVHWATGVISSTDVVMEYLNDSVSALSNENTGKIHATDVLHSPSFAALLLDRAATSVMVSRDARLRSASQEYLKDPVVISGMALRCLALIMQELPTLYERFVTDDQTDTCVTVLDHWEAMRQFVENMNGSILTRIPARFVDSRCGSIKIDEMHRFSRVISTLEWISITTPDSIVSMAAVEVIMTLSELDVISTANARKAVFMSLSTIYEFDNGVLWESEDLALVMNEPFQDWLVRRRGRVNFGDVEKLEDTIECGDLPPWIEFKRKGGRTNRIERHRLATYFCGMQVTQAILEGCAWVRELNQIMSRICHSSSQTKTSQHGKKTTPSRKSSTSARHFIREIDDEKFQTCDVLLEMIGFRTIIFTLLQLVQYGLQSYPIDESLPADGAHDQYKSPLHTIELCLRLLCGIQDLYHKNQQALKLFARNNVCSRDGDFDHMFEGEVISEYISALQQTYRRLEELNQWYTNEIVEVSQLHDKSIDQLQKIVGGAIAAVQNCVQLTDTMRCVQGTNRVNVGHESDANGKRKTPGYAKGKRQRPGTKIEKPNEFSRGWKLIPRLASICEQVRKSCERLARNMGVKNNIKLGSLAATSVIHDKNLYFGIGVEVKAVINDDYKDFENDLDSGEVNDAEEDLYACEDGFHARGAGSGNTSTRTISIRFRSAEKDRS